MNLKALLADPYDSPIVEDLIKFVLRLALAAPFWVSGRTKIEDGTTFSISDTTYVLFENEYSAVPLPPEFAAVSATLAEHLLPVLLVLGLGTRIGAAGLLIMTMVIQIFVYPDAWWSLHLQWAALALAVLVFGPGRYSLDQLLFARKKA